MLLCLPAHVGVFFQFLAPLFHLWVIVVPYRFISHFLFVFEWSWFFQTVLPCLFTTVLKFTILALSMNFIIFNDTKGNRNWLEQNMGSKYRVYSAIRSGQVELKQIWEGCVTIIYSGTKTQDVVYWTTRQYFIPCKDIIYINYLSQDVNALRYIENILQKLSL